MLQDAVRETRDRGPTQLVPDGRCGCAEKTGFTQAGDQENRSFAPRS